MFKLRLFPTLAVLAFCASTVRATAQDVAAYTISDNTSGHLLEQSNATKKLQVGSLAKIATAMVVLDWAKAKGTDLGQLATIPSFVPGLGSTNGVGFRPGDRCSLRDLLYAALMQSDNVAAEALAVHVGQALSSGAADAAPASFFVAQMNALARRLGMNRTRFLNAHGLDTLERSLPHSTAEDMAKLAGYAMANAAFRFHVSQRERKIGLISADGEESAYLLRNTNELLGTSDIDGVKTGTTHRAGQCLIISAARPPESRQEGATHFITPRRLNIVILGSNDRFKVATHLLQRGWRLHEEWAAAGRPLKARARAGDEVR